MRKFFVCLFTVLVFTAPVAKASEKKPNLLFKIYATPYMGKLSYEECEKQAMALKAGRLVARSSVNILTPQNQDVRMVIEKEDYLFEVNLLGSLLANDNIRVYLKKLKAAKYSQEVANEMKYDAESKKFKSSSHPKHLYEMAIKSNEPFDLSRDSFLAMPLVVSTNESENGCLIISALPVQESFDFIDLMRAPSP